MLTPTSIFYFCSVPPFVDSTYQDLNNFFEVIVGQDVQAITKISQKKVVVIEHSPDNFDGLRCIRSVRELDEKIPIIFLAKNPSKIDIINAIRLGASDVFLLPVVKEELISCIYQLVQKSRSSWMYEFVNLLLKKSRKLFRSNNSQLAIHTRSKSNEVLYSSVLFPIPILEKQKNDDNSIQVKVLDEFQIKIGERILKPLKSKKALALMSYLFIHQKKKINKNKLMSTFWGNSNPESAKNCLHVTIYHLRRYFEEQIPNKEIIFFKNDQYGICPKIKLSLDSHLFLENWKRGKFVEESSGLVAAVEFYQKAYMIYQKDFLENIPQENWIEMERENLREIFLVILGKLSSFYFQQGNYNLTIQFCKEALMKDNCLEEVHRRIMACYYALKMRDKAIRQFRKCSDTLKTELDIDPSKTTIELYQKIGRSG